MTPDRRPSESPACRACPGGHSAGARGRAGATCARPSARTRGSRSSRPPACAGSTSSARARSTARWLEERFEFHPLDYEDVFSRNQRPKVDEYDEYLFFVLHFPRYDKTVSRLNAAELDLFVGPDYLITLPNEPLQPVEYLFERCRTNEELRE